MHTRPHLPKSFVLTLISFCLSLLAAGPYFHYYAHAQAGSGFLSYTSAEYGITIEYPSDWYKEEYGTNFIVSFYSPYEDDDDQYSEYVGVFTESVPISKGLDQYVDGYIDELGNVLPELEVLDMDDASLAGNTAIVLVTADTDFDQDGNLDSKTKRMFTIVDQHAFVITYDAVQGKYDAYLPLVDEMIDSVEIDASKLPPARTGLQYLTHDNSEYGAKFQYPDNWLLESSSGEPMVYLYSPYENDLDYFAEFVVVTYEDVPYSTTLREYTDDSIEVLGEEFESFELIESESAFFGGYRGHRVVFTSFSPDVGDQKGGAAWAIKDDRAYFIAFGALGSTYDTYVSAFRKITDSFSITYEGGPAPYQPPGADLETKEFLLYENAGYAFSLEYPDNWEKVETPDDASSAVMFVSPLQDAIISVSVENLLLQPMLLEEYTELSMQSIEEEVSLLQMHDSSAVTMAGHPGHKAVYSGVLILLGDTPVNLKVMQVWTAVQESRAYVITFMSYPDKFDAYLPTAEKVLDSFEVDEEAIPERVAGTYENSELGLAIELPDEWVGFKAGAEMEDLPFDTAIFIIPRLGNLSAEQIQSAEIGILDAFMIIFSANMEDLLRCDIKAEGPDESSTECERSKSANVVLINKMKALEIELDCSHAEMGRYSAKIYGFLTSKDLIFVGFFHIADEPHAEEFAAFEDSLGKLDVKGTVDLSDPYARGSLSKEKKLSVETAMVDGNPYNVTIISNSTITDFKLDAEKKQISFQVDGAAGTEGSMEIEVGDVLQGPHVVTIDGVTVEDGYSVHDKTSGDVTLSFSYPHSAHNVTITGTTVIPEFGVLAGFAMALGLTAVIGVVVVGRKQISSSSS